MYVEKGKCHIDLEGCGFNEVIRRHLKILKNDGKKTRKHDYCKRLANIRNVKPAIQKFLENAKFDLHAKVCRPTEHMNLYKENAVDVHVSTNAKDLKFKILAPPKYDNFYADVFLSEKNMKFNKDENIVTVVYDCSENGLARDRCAKSREFPACKKDRGYNIVKVFDENYQLMSSCEVWVGMAHYYINCRKNTARRRLLQQGGGDS